MKKKVLQYLELLQEAILENNYPSVKKYTISF